MNRDRSLGSGPQLVGSKRARVFAAACLQSWVGGFGFHGEDGEDRFVDALHFKTAEATGRLWSPPPRSTRARRRHQRRGESAP